MLPSVLFLLTLHYHLNLRFTCLKCVEIKPDYLLNKENKNEDLIENNNDDLIENENENGDLIIFSNENPVQL